MGGKKSCRENSSVEEAGPEVFCVRRHLAAVDRVEDVVLDVKRRELVVLAEALALGVRVTHCVAVIARVLKALTGRRRRLKQASRTQRVLAYRSEVCDSCTSDSSSDEDNKGEGRLGRCSGS